MRKHHSFRSPLIFNAEKFSRAYTANEKHELYPSFLGTLLKSAYVFILLAIDIMLFVSSGNLVIFNNSFFPTFEVMILLLLLCAISFSLIGMLHKKPVFQNILCCVFTFWFIVVLFNQFYQLDVNSILGNILSQYLGGLTPKFIFKNSHIIIAAILSILFGWFIFKISEKKFAIYVLMFVLIFISISYKAYNYKQYRHDFMEHYNSSMKLIDKTPKDTKRFIYIMLPNLSSYKYFLMLKGMQAKQAYDIITGFYAYNDFEVYPNAFIEYSDQFMNIVQAVNSFSNKDPDEHILDTMLLYNYWKFFNVNDEYVFLKHNQMYNSFRKAGYKISAYKSRGIDICHTNYNFTVDRCMEKINVPINISDNEISKFDKAKLLFAEWIDSMEIFKIYKKFPININYDNIYTINSIKTFDILAENILSDNGRQAYFVYADLPSDMFIYDEWCNIKPYEKWISNEGDAVNNNVLQKQKAYIEQTKCLYGKLQELIDKLNVKKVFDNSVLIINGLNSNHNFENKAFDDIIDTFIYDKMVALAIKKPNLKGFKLNNSLCSAKNIIQSTLYNVNYSNCDETVNIGIRGSIKNELLEKINNRIDSTNANQNIKIFNNWFEKWKFINNSQNDAIKIIKKENDTIDTNINGEIYELKNEILK